MTPANVSGPAVSRRLEPAYHGEMTGRRLSPSEERAWAAVTRTVKRVAGAEAFRPTTQAEESNAHGSVTGTSGEQDARQGRRSDPHAPRAPGPSGQRSPSSAVADRGAERRVRRGQVPFAARLDLHGHTQASADATLRQFISHQRRSGTRCVLVITGKGRNGEAILKRNFLSWVDGREGRALVSGIAMAHARHGGSGAFYVWLRRADPPG